MIAVMLIMNCGPQLALLVCVYDYYVSVAKIKKNIFLNPKDAHKEKCSNKML